jgi:hypothetical protein
MVSVVNYVTFFVVVSEGDTIYLGACGFGVFFVVLQNLNHHFACHALGSWVCHLQLSLQNLKPPHSLIYSGYFPLG